jgi:hypothetical protein
MDDITFFGRYANVTVPLETMVEVFGFTFVENCFLTIPIPKAHALWPEDCALSSRDETTRHATWETLKDLVPVHKPFLILSRNLKAKKGYRYHYCNYPRSSHTNPNVRFFRDSP